MHPNDFPGRKYSKVEFAEYAKKLGKSDDWSERLWERAVAA